MRIGIIGAGNIGGGLARQLSLAGHDVLLSFSRDEQKLRRLASGGGCGAATPARAAEHGDVVILSVPWGLVDEAVRQTGGDDALRGKVVIDTTNQFGRVDGVFRVLDLGDSSAAASGLAQKLLAASAAPRRRLAALVVSHKISP